MKHLIKTIVVICSLFQYACAQTSCFNIGGTYFQHGYSKVQTSDGGYVVTGVTRYGASDTYVAYAVKADSSGAVQWECGIAGASPDENWSVMQTPDGGYRIIGYTNSVNIESADVYVAILNAMGIVQQVRTTGGTNASQNTSLVQTKMHIQR